MNRTLALLLAAVVVLGTLPTAALAADQYEPNDSPGTAPTLSVPGTYEGLTIDDDDYRDWYAVSLADGATLTATINITPVDGANLALAVWRDADGDGSVESRLTYSNDYAANETVTVTADGAGTYYVDVYHSAGAAVTYDLSLSGTASDGSDGTDDTDDTDGTADDPTFEVPLPGADGEGPPTDTNGDGLFEDVDGDGSASFADAIALAFADTAGLTADQRAALDFDEDGDVDFDDAVDLAFQI